MSIIKWMRKNNTKIMAVVVILLMIAFIGGSSLSYLLQGSGGAGKAIAHYDENKKITRYMYSTAVRELEILQALRADEVLLAQVQAQDLRGILLNQLLFSGSRGSASAMSYAMSMIRKNQYLVSEKQLSEMSNREGASPAVYWILLCDEAQSAGIRIPTADVGQLLSRLIPQLFNGQTYPVAMGSLISRFGVPEQRILDTFGKLLAVLQYAQTICSTEDITIPQLTHIASRSGDSLDAEVVQLEAQAFADKQSTPAPEAMQAQFDKYKGVFAGHVTAEDPFGFGYKLPAHIQLDYLALQLKDVAGIIQPPTAEEAEQYYQQNRERYFTQEVPSDPKDPNSPKVKKVTSYGEVADTIMERLKQQKITTKAEQILEEVKRMADSKLETMAAESDQPPVEELKSKAIDYGTIAQKLSPTYGITLYSGQTGWLNAVELQSDKRLGGLFVSSYAASPVRLSQILFSVDALGDEAATLLFGQRARMYTTIGPAGDPAGATGDLSGQIMAVVRIVGVNKAAEPENLDVSFSTRSIELGDAAEQGKDNTFSVKEKVTEDLRKLAAWDTAKAKGEELMATAAKEDWRKAVAKFNELYGAQAKKEPNDPNVFKIEPLNGLQRISDAQLLVIATQASGNPAGRVYANNARVEKQFIDQLYSLVPADAESAKTPLLMEFKPNQSFYVIKSITVQRLNQQQYEAMKGMILQQEDYVQMENLAVVHFTPANILKRMNYQPVKESDMPAVQQGPAELPAPEDLF